MIFNPNSYKWISASLSYDKDSDGAAYGVIHNAWGMKEDIEKWLDDNIQFWRLYYTGSVKISPEWWVKIHGSLSETPEVEYLLISLHTVYMDEDTSLLFKLTFPEYVFST